MNRELSEVSLLFTIYIYKVMKQMFETAIKIQEKRMLIPRKICIINDTVLFTENKVKLGRC